jgi:hypothetical protein
MAAGTFMDNLGSRSEYLVVRCGLAWVLGLLLEHLLLRLHCHLRPLGKAILNGADSATTISTAVDAWAKTIMVSAQTTSAPPVPTILPLS